MIDKGLKQWARSPVFFAALGGLLGFFYIYAGTDLVNKDGALYLTLAKASQLYGSEQVTGWFIWPYFSILIGYAADVCNISVEVFAYALNAVLIIIISAAFISLVRVLGANEKAQWLAALFIVLFPTLNEMKGAIIRDFGYVAFSLLALLCLIRFERKPAVAPLLVWFLMQLMAMLFRYEAAVFFLVPVFLLLNRKNIKILLLVLVIGAAFVWSLNLYQPVADYWLMLSTVYEKATEGLAQAILNKHSDQYAGGFLIAGVLYMLLANVLAVVGVCVCLPLLGNNKQAYAISTNKALYLYIAINVWVLFLFALERQFMTERYTLLLALMVIALLFSAIKETVDFSSLKIKAPIAIVLLFLFVDSFISFGYSKAYITDTLVWVNNNIDKPSRVISNRRDVNYELDRARNHQDLLYLSPPAKIVAAYDYYIHFYKDRGRKDFVMAAAYIELSRFDNGGCCGSVIYKRR